MVHTPSFKKRFWSEASVVTTEQGHGIQLDGRDLRTPAKALLQVPSRDLALTIAQEWQAQDDVVNSDKMPATRMANSAIDLVSRKFDDVAMMLAEYGGSDLICYRADAPRELVERQAASWDPLIEWSEQSLDAPLVTTTGVLPVEQPSASLRRLSGAVSARNNFELAAIHDLVSLSGSLVIGLAVAANHLPVQQAWDASRVDETWQQEQWGADDAASEVAKRKEDDFKFARRFLFSLV